MEEAAKAEATADQLNVEVVDALTKVGHRLQRIRTMIEQADRLQGRNQESKIDAIYEHVNAENKIVAAEIEQLKQKQARAAEFPEER